MRVGWSSVWTAAQTLLHTSAGLAKFSVSVQTGTLANSPSYTVGTCSFPEVKRAGCVVNRPPLPSAEVAERVELYLYSKSVPLWHVIG